jgi:phosphomannomutase
MIDVSIFKGYDIRGIYPESINEDLAYQIGQAFVSVVKPQKEVLVGHDVRNYSISLKNKLIQGILDCGVDVLDVGLMSTDMLYYGVGTYNTDGGIQVTASHLPSQWHGMKMVKKGVVPMTLESGISQIRDFVIGGKTIEVKEKGKVKNIDIMEDYAKYILSWIDPKKIKPLKIVYNPNFGYTGEVFKKIIEIGNLPLSLVPLNATPDGNFPKGRPDPFILDNRKEFSDLVKTSGADLGIAWDADGDRVFFCSDDGTFMEPYFLNTLLIKSMLQKFPGEKVIYDIRYTWALLNAINENGGIPVLCRVGHSYIKEKMRQENALFAVESSGHTYYRDYWYSDCGMIPPVQILEYISQVGSNLSSVIKSIMQKYYISGEINNEVTDTKAILDNLKETYKDGQQNEIDGLTVEYPNFRFNVRASNTEPLLRLNLEADSQILMETKREEVLKIIKTH